MVPAGGLGGRQSADENVSTTVDDAAPTAFVTSGGHDRRIPVSGSRWEGRSAVRRACPARRRRLRPGKRGQTSRVLESDDGYAVVSNGCLPLSGCAPYLDGVCDDFGLRGLRFDVASASAATGEEGVSRVGIAKGFGLSVTRQAGDRSETARRCVARVIQVRPAHVTFRLRR